MTGFESMKGIKNVIGAIDGTHIPISGRALCNENYINRKGFPSLILQGVCDHNMRFTDCYIGWPGSVHDARVFDNSDLKARILRNPLDMVPGGSFRPLAFNSSFMVILSMKIKMRDALIIHYFSKLLLISTHS